MRIFETCKYFAYFLHIKVILCGHIEVLQEINNFAAAMKRILLTSIGLVSLTLAIVGIFLPILPTTPFLLMSAAIFLKNSPRLYEWLMSHPKLGTYIKNYTEHKHIPLRAKVVSLSLVWISLSYCAFGIADHWLLSVMFLAIAIGVSIHILSFK